MLFSVKTLACHFSLLDCSENVPGTKLILHWIFVFLVCSLQSFNCATTTPLFMADIYLWRWNTERVISKIQKTGQRRRRAFGFQMHRIRVPEEPQQNPEIFFLSSKCDSLGPLATTCFSLTPCICIRLDLSNFKWVDFLRH